jgi:hypothetical protein
MQAWWGSGGEHPEDASRCSYAISSPLCDSPLEIQGERRRSWQLEDDQQLHQLYRHRSGVAREDAS